MANREQLSQQVQDIQADLDLDKKRRKRQKAREREWRAFKDLPTFTPKHEFWCDHCHMDFVAPAYKFYSTYHDVGSWHTVCPVCDSFVYRHITAKGVDPYYRKSHKVRTMQGEHHKDMLQPGQQGFRMLYGDPFERYYRKFQEHSEAVFNKYATMGFMGKTIEQKSEEEIVKSML